MSSSRARRKSDQTSQKQKLTLYTETMDVDVDVDTETYDTISFSGSSSESKKGAFIYALSDLNKKEYTLDDIQKDSDDINEDSESSSAKRHVFELEREIPMPPDFFEVLGQVPSIEDISLDSELKEELGFIDGTARGSRNTDLLGHFTDPLTGAILSSESIDNVEGVGDAVAATLQDESTESSGILLHPINLPELPKAKIIEKKDLDTDVDLEHFFDMPAPTVVQETNFEELLKQEIQRQVEEDTRNLLYTITDKVVAKCEHLDRRTILNAMLDKEELVELVKERIQKLNEAKFVNKFLLKRCTIFFYQKGVKRFLIPDSIRNVRTLSNKYREGLFLIDKMICNKRRLENHFGGKIDKLSFAINEKETSLEEKVAEFEQLVLDTLTKNRSDEFRQYVLDNLASIRAVRADIQTARVEYIGRKREDVLLKKLLVKTNQIGQDVTIDKIELLGAEIQTLDKKLEAINAEIAKKQREFSTTLHFRAHLAEKMEILNISVNNLTHQLDRMLTTREELKDEVHEITKERLAIRREYNELIDSSGGLLNKPLLLDDFDNTSRKLAQVKKKNKEGREKIESTKRFIDQMELTCKNQQPHTWIH